MSQQQSFLEHSDYQKSTSLKLIRLSPIMCSTFHRIMHTERLPGRIVNLHAKVTAAGIITAQVGSPFFASRPKFES